MPSSEISRAGSSCWDNTELLREIPPWEDTVPIAEDPSTRPPAGRGPGGPRGPLGVRAGALGGLACVRLSARHPGVCLQSDLHPASSASLLRGLCHLFPPFLPPSQSLAQGLGGSCVDRPRLTVSARFGDPPHGISLSIPPPPLSLGVPISHWGGNPSPLCSRAVQHCPPAFLNLSVTWRVPGGRRV